MAQAGPQLPPTQGAPLATYLPVPPHHHPTLQFLPLHLHIFHIYIYIYIYICIHIYILHPHLHIRHRCTADTPRRTFAST